VRDQSFRFVDPERSVRISNINDEKHSEK
jgi:hypothetical protein